MAFKIGPKSKRIQELEAALGVDSTPVKPSAPSFNHSSQQSSFVSRNPANLRPLFAQASPASSISPGMVSKFVNKIDERRDQPQTAVMCQHRESRTYKIVNFPPSSRSSAPPPPSNSASHLEELPELSESDQQSSYFRKAEPSSPPNQPPAPTHKDKSSTSYNQSTSTLTPSHQFSTPVHESEAQTPTSPLNQPPTPTHKAEHDSYSPNVSVSSSASQNTIRNAPPSHEPPKRAPPVSPVEGETPKERALNALKKAHTISQEPPSRIPSFSVNSNFNSPKLSKNADSPSNKESKLRIPSRTSALRAAFEREAAMINEPAKPPAIFKKQPSGVNTENQQEKSHLESSKQSDTPPSGVTDITKSWVEGEGFATGWHTKPNKFVVHARDIAGQTVIGSKCVVEMKSKVVHIAPVQVVVRKNTDGSHMCAYVPWHEGDYIMTITLDGRTLSEKQIRIRPASERHAAEIAEAAQKQEEANKRREGEQQHSNSNDNSNTSSNINPSHITRVDSGRSEITVVKRIESGLRQPTKVVKHVPVEARKQIEVEAAKEEEEVKSETELREEQRRLEAEKLIEEERLQERLAREERERAEAEAIAREKEAYEAAAKQVAEEEERQATEEELRLLEREEERQLAQAHLLAEQEETRLLEERAETERLLQEEFEIASRQADLEEAEEARRTATRLREEAEAAQKQMEAEFEEATRLAQEEELEELRLQSELELARHRESEGDDLHSHEESDLHESEYFKQTHEESENGQERERKSFSLEEPSFVQDSSNLESSNDNNNKSDKHDLGLESDWALPSPTDSNKQQEQQSPYGLDPEEAVRQAVSRGKSRTPVNSSQIAKEGGIIAEEDSGVAKALSEAVYRAQKEVIHAEVERIKSEEAQKRKQEPEEEAEQQRMRKLQEVEANMRDLHALAEAKKQQQVETETNNVVNFHAPSSHINRGVPVTAKEELRKQVPQKRPPPPQKRPPAPPSGASPKPAESRTSVVSPSFSSPPTAASSSPPPSFSTLGNNNNNSTNSTSSTIMCACGESNPLNMKFCSGCGKRLAGGGITHTGIHAFVEAQRKAADQARYEANPGLKEKEDREAKEEQQKLDEKERQRVWKEENDARTWEETQRVLDAAETTSSLPPFGDDSVMFHMAADRKGEVDPSRCWLEGDGVEVGWHTRSNKFIVHARDSAGKPVPDAKCVAEMKSLSDRVPNVAVVVHKNAEGTHTCAYLPFNEGEFMLSVSLDGQPVKDTPRKVIVKRR